MPKSCTTAKNSYPKTYVYILQIKLTSWKWINIKNIPQNINISKSNSKNWFLIKKIKKIEISTNVNSLIIHLN